MVPQLCEHTKNYWIVYVKQVKYMLCELYLNKVGFKNKSKVHFT